MEDATLRDSTHHDESGIFEQVGEYRYSVGSTIGGRYVVCDRAAGSYGQVYFCYDQEEDYFYALKTLRLSHRLLADATAVLLFQREVSHWLALGDHDHIVRCFTLVSIDNLPFIVLEWLTDDDRLTRLYREHHANGAHFMDWYARLGRAGLELRRQQVTRNSTSGGTSLAGWIKRHKRLPLAFALQIALDVCAGLAHAQYILEQFVHRDVNPRNILLNEQLRAKVSDFGLALAQHEMRETDHIAGSAPYMAPEQWRRDALDFRADIYALGCTLYEMLTGQPPFFAEGLKDAELRRRHLEQPPPHLPAHLPSALDAVVQRCLHKADDARFGSWQELIDAITKVFVTTQGTLPQLTSEYRPLSVEDLNRIAVTYHGIQAYDLALKMLEQAIELNAGYANSFTNRGCIYYVQGDYKAALADYSLAIRLGRRASNGVARNNRGLLFLKQGKPQQALHDLEEAVASAPEYANAHANLGVAYLLLGLEGEALMALSRAIALAPTHVLAHHNRGYVFHSLAQRAPALDDYKAASDHDPMFLPARINRMLIWREQGRLAEAEDEYQQIAWISGRKGRWQQMEHPGYQLGSPDPQFRNTQRLDEELMRPLYEHRRATRSTLTSMGAATSRLPHLPVRAVVNVISVAYADSPHPRVLDHLDAGWRLTQVQVDVMVKPGNGAADEEQPVICCGLWLDEAAMHELARAGLQTLEELPGHWLELVNDHPDDPTHPLRLHAVRD